MSEAPPSRKGRRLHSFRGTRITLPPPLCSPNPKDEEEVQQWLRATAQPWAIDLFAGAGGLSLGLKEAGFSVIASADHDSTALETHSHNIGGLAWCGSLEDPDDFILQLEHWGITSVDLVAGGPPCQPFSRAGTPKIASLVRRGDRRPMDRRTNLWRSFLRVIDHLNPRAVLLENVPDFARKQHGSSLIELLSALEERNYKTHAALLESWRYGVPQLRERLFVIAIEVGRDFQWPTPSVDKPTLFQAIGDLPVVEGGQREETLPYQENQQSKFARRMRRDLVDAESDRIRDHITRFVREDDAEIFSLMEQGQTYKDVPKRLRRYRSDIFTDKYNRLTWDGLSRTITAHIAKDGYWYIHPSQDRTLSIREAARIQTFPDSFRFAGAPTDRYRQIGNAVPPFLAESVGTSLYQSLDSTRIRESGAQYVVPTTRDRLTEWYGKSGRSFKWRETKDPWLTLLAEVCLHRTRADQVADIFSSLIDLADTPENLVRNQDDARKMLAHLGLDWRVSQLFDMSEKLIEDYSGIVPDRYDELIHLPGVGDYIASAVLCFAFDQPTTLLDTNTRRFVRRYAANDKLPPWEQRLLLHQLAKPGVADAIWNYALLDLGALVCKARVPDCGRCPVRFGCSTGKDLERADN